MAFRQLLSHAPLSPAIVSKAHRTRLTTPDQLRLPAQACAKNAGAAQPGRTAAGTGPAGTARVQRGRQTHGRESAGVGGHTGVGLRRLRGFDVCDDCAAEKGEGTARVGDLAGWMSWRGVSPHLSPVQGVERLCLDVEHPLTSDQITGTSHQTPRRAHRRDQGAVPQASDREAQGRSAAVRRPARGSRAHTAGVHSAVDRRGRVEESAPDF